MSEFPTVKATDFIRVITKLDYYFDRQRGSHAVYKNLSGARVVIPMHAGKDLKPGILGALIKDIGLEKAQFFELLKDV